LKLYAGGVVPPVPTAVAVPVVCPKQSTLTDEETVTVTAVAGCVMVTLAVAEQLLASVATTL
jgi:hypothetical protein